MTSTDQNVLSPLISVIVVHLWGEKVQLGKRGKNGENGNLVAWYLRQVDGKGVLYTCVPLLAHQLLSFCTKSRRVLRRWSPRWKKRNNSRKNSSIRFGISTLLTLSSVFRRRTLRWWSIAVTFLSLCSPTTLCCVQILSPPVQEHLQVFTDCLAALSWLHCHSALALFLSPHLSLGAPIYMKHVYWERIESLQWLFLRNKNEVSFPR